MNARMDARTCPRLDVWINELHYNNEGSDVNEGVELAGRAGTGERGDSTRF